MPGMVKGSEGGTALALRIIICNIDGSIGIAEASKLLYAVIPIRFDKTINHTTTREKFYGVR